MKTKTKTPKSKKILKKKSQKKLLKKKSQIVVQTMTPTIRTHLRNLRNLKKVRRPEAMDPDLERLVRPIPLLLRPIHRLPSLSLSLGLSLRSLPSSHQASPSTARSLGFKHLVFASLNSKVTRLGTSETAMITIPISMQRF